MFKADSIIPSNLSEAYFCCLDLSSFNNNIDFWNSFSNDSFTFRLIALSLIKIKFQAARLFQIEAVSYTAVERYIQYCYLGILVVNLILSGIIILAHW
jgi:hypothetical protein